MKDIPFCPQCQEPTTKAGGSGRTYCNLCGWVDTREQTQSTVKQKVSEPSLQLSASAMTNLSEKVQKRGEEVTQYLKTSGDRFPVVNFLVVAFYILGSLFLTTSFYLVFQDGLTKNDAWSYAQRTSNEIKVIGLFFGVFIGLMHFAIAEGFKLSLAIENHLYTMRKKTEVQS